MLLIGMIAVPFIDNVYADTYGSAHTNAYSSAYTNAYGSVGIQSTYYEMDDFLEIGGDFKGYTTIDIVGDNFKKGYKVDYTTWHQFGLPLTKNAGYSPGIYDVTITYDNTSYTQQFGLDVKVPQFTLFYEASMVPLNEYAFFYGQVVGIEPKDMSYSGNVVISVLDSNGDLVEDNWIPRKNTIKTAEDKVKATKSTFRAPIFNGDIFLTTMDDNNIFEHRTVQENGYRLYVKLDPTIYKPYHIYTIKAQHGEYIKTVDFMVLDYKDSYFTDNNVDICKSEQKNFDNIKSMYDNFIEIKAYDLAEKYQLRMNNFEFSEECN